MQVAPFRITPEDLPDLPKETREALVPLLDALNVTLSQVVTAIGAQVAGWPNEGFFTTDENGAALVDLVPQLTTKPVGVEVNWLRRADNAAIAAPYGMTWSQIGTGPRLLFVNLETFTKYSFRVTVK